MTRLCKLRTRFSSNSTKRSPMPIPIIDPSQATTNERLARLEAIAEQHTLALAEIKAHIARVEDRMDNYMVVVVA